MPPRPPARALGGITPCIRIPALGVLDDLAMKQLECEESLALTNSILTEQQLETERLRTIESARQEEEARRARQRARGHISISLRNSVWQRDDGQCVECGSKANLEFDILFRSVGAAPRAIAISSSCARAVPQQGRQARVMGVPPASAGVFGFNAPHALSP